MVNIQKIINATHLTCGNEQKTIHEKQRILPQLAIFSDSILP